MTGATIEAGGYLMETGDAMGHERLGGEDAAWLHTERPTNPMVVNALVELSGVLPLDRACALVEKLAKAPRFTSRVVEPELPFGRPELEPVLDFDAGEHIERREVASEAELRSLIGALVSSPLDPRRPLWRLYVIDRPGAGSTLLCRVHHAMADGFAQVELLLSLCDDPPDGPARATPPRPDVPGGLVASARALGHLVALPPDPKTLLKGQLGTEKRVAWARPIPLSGLKASARALSATINDVLVAVTAGAIGRYLARRGEKTLGLEVHAMLPVNLRKGGERASIGNQFGLVLPSLPLGIGDPLARVEAVKERMGAIKHTPEAAVAHGLLRALGWSPRPVEDLAVSFFASKASLVLTNVPGPRERLSLGGVPIERVLFWVPQAGRIGLGVSIFSYAGEVSIGVISDASLIPDPGALVDDVHAELASLEEHVRALDRAPAAVAAGRVSDAAARR